MAEVTELIVESIVRLDDTLELRFQTYSLGKMRLGGTRIFRHSEKYSGPTKSGIDMNLAQLSELGPLLVALLAQVETGEVVPPLEFARFPAGRGAEWIIQLLEEAPGTDDFLLDVRKYVTGEKYTGFTRKGLRIDFEWIDTIIKNMVLVRGSLEAWGKGQSGLFSPAVSTAPSTAPEQPKLTDAVPDEYREFF